MKLDQFCRALVLNSLVVALGAAPQMDDRFRRQQAETGGRLQAFAVDVYPSGPIEIEQVEQIRQAYGRHRFAVTVKNRSAQAITSCVLVGLVVASDGSIKATQPLPPIKNLKSGHSRRQETELRVAVLGLSDLFVFAASEVQPAGAEVWKIADADLRAAVKAASGSLPRQ